jgi:hypothetical protein
VVYSIDGRSTQSHVAEQMDLLFRNSTYRAEVDEAVGEDLKQQNVPPAAPDATKGKIPYLTCGLTRVGVFLKNGGLNSSLEDVSAIRRETIESFRWPEGKEDPVGYALEKGVRMSMGNGQHVRLPYDTCVASSPLCMGAVAVSWPTCCPCRRERFALCVLQAFFLISICRELSGNDGYRRQARIWRQTYRPY